MRSSSRCHAGVTLESCSPSACKPSGLAVTPRDESAHHKWFGRHKVLRMVGHHAGTTGVLLEGSSRSAQPFASRHPWMMERIYAPLRPRFRLSTPSRKLYCNVLLWQPQHIVNSRHDKQDLSGFPAHSLELCGSACAMTHHLTTYIERRLGMVGRQGSFKL